MTAEKAIRERVLAPLGLDRSFFFAHEAITYRAAVGHNRPPGKELSVARPYPLIRAMNAAGGIIGTVEDLLRFARFHLKLGALTRSHPPTSEASPPGPPGDGVAEDGTTVLSGSSIEAMQTVQTRAGLSAYWGLGWSLDEVDGQMVAGHGGSTNGFRAKLTFVPGKGVALAALANGNGGRPLNQVLERWFLERYAGLRPLDPPVAEVSAEALARCAGHYRSPTSEVEVTAVNGGLQVDMTSTNPLSKEQITWPAQRLNPAGGARFLLADGESVGEPVEFIGDGEAPTFMRYHGRLLDRVET
jgi:CubicO group peptidase (beta-lactamase class C family)